MTESLVLALAGAAVALPLSAWLTRVVTRIRPPLPIDLGLRIAPDWRVALFTLGVALATGIVFGLLPAWRSSRPDLVPALKEGGEWTIAAGAGKRRVELRDGLVVIQMAVSLVLLVGGAMLVRSLAVAGRVDLGYQADRVAMLALAMEMNGYDAERAGRFFEAARLRLEGLPGVQAVGLTSRVPLSLNNNGFGLFIDGRQTSSSDEPFRLDGAYVDEHYFDVLGLRLVAGRGIESRDRDGTRRVAVVTRAMAERFWPGQDPLGREFRLGWGMEPTRIVGVVEDHKVDTPGESPKPYLHLALGRREVYGGFLVRTAGPAADQVPVLERELRVLDPDLVFLDTGTLREQADIRLFPIRAGAWLIGAFGFLALMVAAVGLYGVIAYSVSRRFREIGIRKALGAEPRQLVVLVLGEGMRLVGIGGLLGAGLAAMATRALSSVLFVGSLDLASFGLSLAVLAAVGLLANGVPARRAARVDPMVTLREGG
jgi:predicted permease